MQRVHSDYTPENGPRKLRELAEAGVVSEREIANRRWSIVNVWCRYVASEYTALPCGRSRPMQCHRARRSIDAEQPVRAQPLAVRRH